MSSSINMTGSYLVPASSWRVYIPYQLSFTPNWKWYRILYPKLKPIEVILIISEVVSHTQKANLCLLQITRGKTLLFGVPGVSVLRFNWLQWMSILVRRVEFNFQPPNLGSKAVFNNPLWFRHYCCLLVLVRPRFFISLCTTHICHLGSCPVED